MERMSAHRHENGGEALRAYKESTSFKVCQAYTVLEARPEKHRVILFGLDRSRYAPSINSACKGFGPLLPTAYDIIVQHKKQKNIPAPAVAHLLWSEVRKLTIDGKGALSKASTL